MTCSQSWVAQGSLVEKRHHTDVLFPAHLLLPPHPPQMRTLGHPAWQGSAVCLNTVFRPEVTGTVYVGG